MPEPYWPKRKGSYTLSSARKNTSLARIACRYCKRAHHYTLDDLRAVFGDIEVDDVVLQMRCSGCDNRHTLVIDLVSPSAADRQVMTIRRLDQIYYVRRVTWRDDEGG